MLSYLCFLVWLSFVGCSGSSGEGFALFEEQSIVQLNDSDNDNAPMLTSVPDQTVVQDTAINIDVNNEITGSDENMNYICVYDMIVDGNVPIAFPCKGLAGSIRLDFNEETGELNWVPDSSIQGTYEFMIQGETSSGKRDSEIFSITINENKAPILTNIIDQQYGVGSEVTFDINDERTASDAGVSYTCSFDTTLDLAVDQGLDCNLLPGTPTLKFSGSSGIFSWFPSIDAEGLYEVKIVGTKRGCRRSKFFAFE